MPFHLRNQEWKKRKANRGGRPTRAETAKNLERTKARNRRIKLWAEAKAAWDFDGILGSRRGHCPFCGKIS